jgi:hypothetical protein
MVKLYVILNTHYLSIFLSMFNTLYLSIFLSMFNTLSLSLFIDVRMCFFLYVFFVFVSSDFLRSSLSSNLTSDSSADVFTRTRSLLTFPSFFVSSLLFSSFFSSFLPFPTSLLLSSFLPPSSLLSSLLFLACRFFDSLLF